MPWLRHRSNISCKLRMTAVIAHGGGTGARERRGENHSAHTAASPLVHVQLLELHGQALAV